MPPVIVFTYGRQSIHFFISLLYRKETASIFHLFIHQSVRWTRWQVGWFTHCNEPWPGCTAFSFMQNYTSSTSARQDMRWVKRTYFKWQAMSTLIIQEPIFERWRRRRHFGCWELLPRSCVLGRFRHTQDFHDIWMKCMSSKQCGQRSVWCLPGPFDGLTEWPSWHDY